MSPAVSAEHALLMINRLFISALLAMAEAGEAEQACRLAAQGYSALRHCHPREAERLNGLLHRLTRDLPVPSPDEPGVMI
jgi:hypothetical protein